MPLHYAVLASVSGRYSPLEGRLLTCYSPVRHFMHSPKGALIVRLACLRHAASVDSEPGSNSRYKFVLWNIIRYWLLSYSVSIMTLASFRRELYRSRLTLKGLETDTLYLVFKHRVQIVIWIALQTILTRPKQTGILTNDPRSVKPS